MNAPATIILLLLCLAVAAIQGFVLMKFLRYLDRLEEARWGKVARSKEWNTGLAAWLAKLSESRRSKK